jgi:hypothetical protein
MQFVEFKIFIIIFDLYSDTIGLPELGNIFVSFGQLQHHQFVSLMLNKTLEASNVEYDICNGWRYTNFQKMHGWPLGGQCE